MSLRRELESTFFFFGFRECKKKPHLNFLKLTNQDYLLMRIFDKTEIADLFHAKYDSEDNPCNSEPYWEETIILSFSPDSDNQKIKDFIESFKNK